MKPPQRRWLLAPALLAACVCLAWTQVDDRPAQIRLPNGKMQSEEILKAEHEQNLKDAARLVEMTEELKQDLEKNDRHVLSMATLKKTDEIEKLVRKIRSRLRRH
jgi:cell division protein ZapA (FtsZ GTPase activity inhibitor)